MLMASPTETTLILSWDPPAEPNGVIITYTLYVDYLNGITTNFPTPFEQFIISPLRPYQTISVQVSANTSVGEGPRTLSREFTTAEASEFIQLCMQSHNYSTRLILMSCDKPFLQSLAQLVV